MQAIKKWHNILKGLKEKKFQPRIFYSAKLSLRIKGEIRSFPDKQKLKEFSTTRLVSQEMLKVLGKLKRKGPN